MADERILAGIRRFWTREEVETAYRAVLAAYANAATESVAIVGTSFDGGSASGQWVLDRGAMAVWMDVLEGRLRELDAEDAGDPAMAGGAPVTVFSNRFVGT